MKTVNLKDIYMGGNNGSHYKKGTMCSLYITSGLSTFIYCINSPCFITYYFAVHNILPTYEKSVYIN